MKNDLLPSQIVGPPEGVAKAKELLMEQARRIENEANVELIIDQKWHPILIGTKGENIQKIRVKYPDVQVSFPTAPRKADGEKGLPVSAKKVECDKVNLRGPRKEVQQVSEMLKKQLNIIVEENFSMKVPIMKNHHRYIIGKGGANIKRYFECLSFIMCFLKNIGGGGGRDNPQIFQLKDITFKSF